MVSDYRGTVFARAIPPRLDNPRWDEFERAFAPRPVELAEHARLAKAVVDELNLSPGSRALEVGAGIGLIALELASRGVEVHDLDIVTANVDLVSHVARHLSLDVTAVHGDSCHLPFADECFDAVFSKSVFEHIHDQEAALDEQIRVVKTGGRIMILDGNFLNPFTLFDLLFRRPGQSKGRYGGLRWLLRKNRVHSDYGMGWLGKDEDIKTIWWWRRRVRSRPNVIPVRITTTRRYFYPEKTRYRIFEAVAGTIVVVLEKVGQTHR